MDEQYTPEMFRRLCSMGCAEEKDILKTADGFRILYRSLSDILSEKGIDDFPGADGERLSCSRFYDDWFLYAVPGGMGHTYGLLKFREQEHDREDGLPADGDAPGVTVSFVSFAYEILLECILDPSDENRKRLDWEINRVVARRGQTHHSDLKRYFADPKSLGAYLMAELYVRHIAAFAGNGYLELPEQYKKTVRQHQTHKNSARLARLPAFIETLNRKAGYPLCGGERLYVRDPENLTQVEAAAILAAHTGNTSVYSFAAEVEYHAKFLTPLAKIRLPFIGRSVYDSAIRADMSTGDTEFQGLTPFYRETSRIVRRQRRLHLNEETMLSSRREERQT